MKQQYENVLIVGATSQIAISFARLISPNTKTIVLCGRNQFRLEEVASDISARSSSLVETVTSVDAAIVDKTFDLVLFCSGFFPGDDEPSEWDENKVREIFQVNLVSVVCDLVKVATKRDNARHMQVVVLGSIAGDRGKGRNRTYAAAKSGLATYVEGLRQALRGEGIHFLLVKPGPTRSPMTVNSSFHLAEPQVVATDILRALTKKKKEIYSPYRWKWIMLIVRWLPESILCFVEKRNMH